MTERLVASWRATGSEAIRARIIQRQGGLVQALAAKFARRGVPVDDLVQTAWVALISALPRFDPERGATFRTYAAHCIVGEIKHYLRDRTWALKVPRGLQDVALKLGEMQDRLVGRLGRQPTMAEMAAAFEITEERLAEAIGLFADYHVAGLDAPTWTTEENDPLPLAECIGTEDGQICSLVENAPLYAAIAELAPRDQFILYHRFFDGDSQTRVGKMLGLSQMQVCRLERASLKQLRTSMRH